MINALRSEIRKLRWTRCLWAIPLLGILVSAASAAVLIAAFKRVDIPARLSDHGPLRFGPTNVGLLLLLFGVRLYADETHHHTIASTYVSTPRRLAVLVAKAVTGAVVALGTCVAIYAFVVPITLIGVARRGPAYGGRRRGNGCPVRSRDPRHDPDDPARRRRRRSPP